MGAGSRANPPAPHGFAQDGLLFLQADSLYEQGSSPLCLVWKDPVCSRFFIDHDEETVTHITPSYDLNYPADAIAVSASDGSSSAVAHGTLHSDCTMPGSTVVLPSTSHLNLYPFSFETFQITHFVVLFYIFVV